MAMKLISMKSPTIASAAARTVRGSSSVTLCPGLPPGKNPRPWKLLTLSISAAYHASALMCVRGRPKVMAPNDDSEGNAGQLSLLDGE